MVGTWDQDDLDVIIPGPKDTSINGVTFFHDICDIRDVLVLSDEQKLLLPLFSFSYIHLSVGLPWILWLVV